MKRDEDRRESRVNKGRPGVRISLLAKLRWRAAPNPPSEPQAAQTSAPRHPAAGAPPAPLPRRQPGRASRSRHPVPRVQRPDDQVLSRVARALRRL
jgi:hypothetical protein